uniref:Putative ixostatin n=1 Tax=Ixodes ricinus TaxID=34613 RepID=A0A0K8R473_IXORI
MRLTKFMVIMAFTHLCYEVKSVSCWHVDQDLKHLKGPCKGKLIDEIENKCSQQSGGSRWAEFHGCSFVCEETATTSQTNSKIRVIKTLKNGIPCGKDGKTCYNGQCVDACHVDFVNA